VGGRRSGDSGGRRRNGAWLERAAVAAGGVYLTATGASALSSGRLLYADYLGAPMLAPLTLLVGALLLAVALCGWNVIAKRF
jgi:hypothetical protein